MKCAFKKICNTFKLTQFCLVMLIFYQSQSINQSCTKETDCPTNFFCGDQGYCVCQANFIVACQIQATPLSDSFQEVNVSYADQKFFIVKPKFLGTYIKFAFQICFEENFDNSIVATIWGQTGFLKNLTDVNRYIRATFGISEGKCSYIETTYFEFGVQPNGELMELYLGLKLLSSSSQYEAKINVIQEQSFNPELFQIIGIALMGTITIAIVILAGYYFYKRRRVRATRREIQKKNKQINSISHFEEFMPIIQAKDIRSSEPLQICSVCLSDINLEDSVRVTSCLHVFHVQCIDSWCQKNISCPICRQQLDKHNCKKIITERKNRSNSPSSVAASIQKTCDQNRQDFELINRSQMASPLNNTNQDEIEYSVLDRGSIRNRMLE